MIPVQHHFRSIASLRDCIERVGYLKGLATQNTPGWELFPSYSAKNSWPVANLGTNRSRGFADCDISGIVQ
jgi:hypothetical protein